jgi:hypothetical protein
MNDNPLRGFEPPPPPPGLREAALRAARGRLAGDQLPDVWTRVIRGRATRLAWAASVVLLAAAHLVLPRSRDGERPGVTVIAPYLEPEVRAIAELPRIDDRAYAACSGGRS